MQITHQSLAQKATIYANRCHAIVNHFYDKQHPYSCHLDMAENFALRFIHLLPDDIQVHDMILAGIRCHDVMEPRCGETFSDVKREINEQVAELVYAVTNEKGRTRAERANDKYYEGIRNTPYATFIKLCDRIANVEYGYSKYHSMNGSAKQKSMFLKYKKEHFHFVQQLWDEQYKEMFDYLEKVFQE